MVRTLSKEALHISNQHLLQVLKAFENELESQLKYITGDRARNNFSLFRPVMQSRALPSRPRPGLKFETENSETRDLKFETETSNFEHFAKILFWMSSSLLSWIFFISGIFQHVLVVSYLQNTANKKSLNFRNFTKLFLCNIHSLETCSFRDWDETWNLRDRDSQKWISRLETPSLVQT